MFDFFSFHFAIHAYWFAVDFFLEIRMNKQIKSDRECGWQFFQQYVWQYKAKQKIWHESFIQIKIELISNSDNISKKIFCSPNESAKSRLSKLETLFKFVAPQTNPNIGICSHKINWLHRTMIEYKEFSVEFHLIMLFGKLMRPPRNPNNEKTSVPFHIHIYIHIVFAIVSLNWNID